VESSVEEDGDGSKLGEGMVSSVEEYGDGSGLEAGGEVG
jgi:hypothetical protein